MATCFHGPPRRRSLGPVAQLLVAAAGVAAMLGAAGLSCGPAWAQAAASPAADGIAPASDYSIDLSELEKKPYQLGGFAELDAYRLTLNPGGALYHLQYPTGEQPRSLIQSGAKLQLEGGYTWDWLALNARVQASGFRDRFGSESDGKVLEAYAAAKPTPTATVELGKRVARWGKGYAWNPTAFVSRPKDPNDPDLAQEGYVMARAEAIQSFQSDVRNVALTLVLLPVRDHVNGDFGRGHSLNVAGKLSLLAWDTDLDLMALSSGTRSSRYGWGFSRNLGSNVEVHGEWARLSQATQPVLQPSGQVQTRVDSPRQWLLGVRYLTEFDLTAIAEYYVNDAGYSQGEMATYARAVDNAWQQAQTRVSSSALDRVINLQSAYARPNPGRRYAYLRLIQKEPFDWLYVTPGLIAIANLDDHSHMVTTEVSYTGITNLDLRARLIWLRGDAETEFAEKPFSHRVELRAQWYF